jgi:two-component system response regulator FixJ
MKDKIATIFIIDDDASVRRSLSLLLTSHGYVTKSFSSSEDFLASEPFDGIGCIILDLELDGIDGLELQEQLGRKSSTLPIIFMTGHGNIAISVKALRAGAITFLEKPCPENELFVALSEALMISRKRINDREAYLEARSRIDTLSPREMDVLKLVITGMLNKQVAGELNIAEHTVKLHRQHITEKLGVKSMAEIIHIAQLSGLAFP